MRDDFAVFILTHKRAENIATLKLLKKVKYTGKWFLVIDDKDEEKDLYYKLYPGKVLEFSKQEVAKSFDIGDNFKGRDGVVIFARNACWGFAEKLGLKYFLQLDDDYNGMMFRYIRNEKLLKKSVKNADEIFSWMIDFLETSKALTVAFAQGGDFVGGKDGSFKKKILRKAMNTFFCTINRKFNFVGRINEDVNTYASLSREGKLFFTITRVMINQVETQKNKGGMTETYLDSGTYLKSFYSVMFAPSCVKIAAMGNKYYRIHHKIEWGACAPKILEGRWKK